LLISAIVRDENEAMEVAIGSVFPAMLLSGIIWPVEGMPDWVQFISNFSPLTHNAEAIRSVASRGKTFMLKICWVRCYGTQKREFYHPKIFLVWRFGRVFREF
jgi:ABC-type multidrug transport system permease subunit